MKADRRLGAVFLVILLLVSLQVLPFSLLGQSAAGDASDPHGRKPSLDAFTESAVRRALSPAERQALKAASKPGTSVHIEERLGVPTFLWVRHRETGGTAGLGSQGMRPEMVAARGHLGRHAALYRLSQRDVDSATGASIHNAGRGAVIVKFRQSVGGVEVFREELNVVMGQGLDLVAILTIGRGARVTVLREIQ